MGREGGERDENGNIDKREEIEERIRNEKVEGKNCEISESGGKNTRKDNANSRKEI